MLSSNTIDGYVGRLTAIRHALCRPRWLPPRPVRDCGRRGTRPRRSGPRQRRQARRLDAPGHLHLGPLAHGMPVAVVDRRVVEGRNTGTAWMCRAAAPEPVLLHLLEHRSTIPQVRQGVLVGRHGQRLLRQRTRLRDIRNCATKLVSCPSRLTAARAFCTHGGLSASTGACPW